MKETIKKLQQYITTIKTVVISKLCVSLKKEITEKDLVGKDKFGRFDNNFGYEYYMEIKEKIEGITRLGVLISKIRDYTITLVEYTEFRILFTKFSGVNKKEYDELLTTLNLSSDDEIIKMLNNYTISTYDEKIRIGTFVGTLSGATMAAQINFVKDFKIKRNGRATKRTSKKI